MAFPRKCVLVLPVAALLWTALAADWPRFRGPHSSAVSDDKGLPVKWSDTENVVWKTKLPGRGGSSPVTFGKFIFLTCYTGYATGADDGDPKKLRRHLLCLDRKTGRILWNKEVAAKLPEARYNGRMTLNGYATNTPATDGKNVYAFFGKSGVVAYDFKGNQLWQKEVGTGTDKWGSATSVLLYKDLVIVNASVESGALVALHKKDGSQAWKAPGIRRSWSSPILVDVGKKQELVLSTPQTIRGFDPESGKELWTCAGIPDGYVCPTAVAHRGVVYVIGGRHNTAVAVKAGGRGDVTESHRLWTRGAGANVPSAVVFGDHLYWVNERGIAWCLKTKDGAIVFQERLRGTGLVYASATIADGKMYVPSRENGTYVLAAKPKFELLAHNTFKDDSSIFNACPVVSQKQLLLRSDRFLYCLGKK
jgi:outer membrane protein assembly factor BamB